LLSPNYSGNTESEDNNMMRFPIWGVAVGSICLFLTIGGQQGALADEALAKRFLEEAPRKWQEYKPLLRGYEQQRDSLTELTSGKIESRSLFRQVCGTDGLRALLDGWQKQGDREEKATVSGSNPDYDFELR
jgi:hypothetical protein